MHLDPVLGVAVPAPWALGPVDGLTLAALVTISLGLVAAMWSVYLLVTGWRGRHCDCRKEDD